MKYDKNATRRLFQAIGAADDVECWSAIHDGADPNGLSSEGYSVIQHAAGVVKARTPIVEFLLGCGAEPNRMGGAFDSALVQAIRRDHREITYLLLEHGADMELRPSPERFTALGEAAYNGRAELFKHLVQRGGDLNAPQHAAGDVMNPMQLAVRGGYPDIVRYCLTELGLDLQAKTAKKGRSLLQLAATFPEVKEVLRSHKIALAVQDEVDAADDQGSVRRVVSPGFSL